MSGKKRFYSLMAAVAFSGLAMFARAVTETDSSNGTGYQADVPSTSVNLLAAPGTTLTISGEAPANPDGREGTSTSWSTLVDGSFGAGNGGRVAIANNWTLTYTFADSYALAAIDTFSAWNDDGRVHQNYTVSYCTADAPDTFIPIQTVSYRPGGVNSTWVHLADLAGINAKAVRFAFGSQQNGHVGHPELAVQGNIPVLAVALTSPTNSQALSTSGPVFAGAAVADYGTPPYSVAFYLKEGSGSFASAGTDETEPYQVSLGTLAAGTYEIYATVTDRATPVAGSATSATNTFIVADLAPTVAIIGPVNNTDFLPGAAIVIDASAADDYAVAEVDFYADGSLLGSDSTAPYTYTWSGAALGPHVVTAVATDGSSQTTTSAAVTVRVVVPPFTVNLAPDGAAVRDGGGEIPWLIDLDNRNNDLVNWVGVTWGAQQTFNTLYMQCGNETGHYPVDVNLQVAKPGVTNPRIDADDDWATPAAWSLRGNTCDFLAVSLQSPVKTCGVRVKPLSGTWRPVELLVLQGVTSNAVPAAIVGGWDNWTTWGTEPMSRLWNGDFFYTEQGGIEDTSPLPLTYDWATPRTIAAVLVAGGAGSYATAYDVEYQDGEGKWQTAVNMAGITSQVSVVGFTPLTSAHFRVKLNGTSDNQYQRISDIMLFEAYVPTPPGGTVLMVR